MGILLSGVLLIVLAQAVVMIVPLLYYLKRDQKWLASDRSRESWYHCSEVAEQRLRTLDNVSGAHTETFQDRDPLHPGNPTQRHNQQDHKYYSGHILS